MTVFAKAKPVGMHAEHTRFANSYVFSAAQVHSGRMQKAKKWRLYNRVHVQLSTSYVCICYDVVVPLT